MGICNANSSTVMTPSYSVVLFEDPFLREKEYEIRVLFLAITLWVFLSFSPYWTPGSTIEVHFPCFLGYYRHDLFVCEICCERRLVRDEVSCQKINECSALCCLMGYILNVVL